MKAIRRILATLAMTVLAFKAVASFMSWIEKQEDESLDTWVDEEEFEEA